MSSLNIIKKLAREHNAVSDYDFKDHDIQFLFKRSSLAESFLKDLMKEYPCLIGHSYIPKTGMNYKLGWRRVVIHRNIIPTSR